MGTRLCRIYIINIIHIAIIAASYHKSIHNDPNVAVVQGDDIKFDCVQTQTVSDPEPLLWRYYEFSGTNGTKSYKDITIIHKPGSTVLNNGIPMTNYRLSSDGKHKEKLDLTIESVSTKNAGLYACIVGEIIWTAALVVFESKLQCSPRRVLDNQSVCTVRYAGNWSPQLELIHENGTAITKGMLCSRNSSEEVVQLTCSLYHNATSNGRVLCRTYFTLSGLNTISRPDQTHFVHSDAAPSYNESCLLYDPAGVTNTAVPVSFSVVPSLLQNKPTNEPNPELGITLIIVVSTISLLTLGTTLVAAVMWTRMDRKKLTSAPDLIVRYNRPDIGLPDRDDIDHPTMIPEGSTESRPTQTHEALASSQDNWKNENRQIIGADGTIYAVLDPFARQESVRSPLVIPPAEISHYAFIDHTHRS